MKHKKESKNIKSVNKPTRPSSRTETLTKIVREKASSNDCHQDIVKRLMTHSQYFPSNPNNKLVPVTYSNPPATAYPITQYAPFNAYSNTQAYSGCYYQQAPQQQQPSLQSFDHFANINVNPPCLSPSLSSPSTQHNFDHSETSPRSDYVFNGDFALMPLNYNAEYEHSFPFEEATAKSQQLFDNQAPLEIKSFDVGSSIGAQLAPVKSESHPNGGIKSSFIDGKNNNSLPNLSDDDVLSNASCSSRPSTSGTIEWFTEHGPDGSFL